MRQFVRSLPAEETNYPNKKRQPRISGISHKLMSETKACSSQLKTVSPINCMAKTKVGTVLAICSMIDRQLRPVDGESIRPGFYPE